MAWGQQFHDEHATPLHHEPIITRPLRLVRLRGRSDPRALLELVTARLQPMFDLGAERGQDVVQRHRAHVADAEVLGFDRRVQAAGQGDAGLADRS